VIRAIVVTFRLSTERIVTLAKNGGVFGLACLIELGLRQGTLPLIPPFFALLARFLSESSAFAFTRPIAIAARRRSLVAELGTAVMISPSFVTNSSLVITAPPERQ